MRALFCFIACLFATLLSAQESASESIFVAADASVEVVVETTVLESVSVPVEMVNQSWFTDRSGTAVIHFDEVVETPEALPTGVRGVSFIDVEVRETPDSKSGKAAAIVRFLLRETGIVTFPTLEFIGETKRYQTIPQQLSVSSVVRSDVLSLSLNPVKLQVYVGEPLRVDMAWQCDLEASRLQALNLYPAFFNDANVEVVVPRSTEPEGKQVGLPIGGRRVIAKRSVEDGKKALGTVELPMYLRFKEAGVYQLPTTRLECAYLQQGSRNFGQYAAHFNNSLFAAEESDVRYERFFVETAPVEIEVLPLPEAGRLPGFSGLFEPVRFEVSATPTAMRVGELMQAEVQVFTDAPHGMIDLPQLSRQRGLRGRFLVDDELARLWRADGTTFRCRLRALTTAVQAFPALQIQTFDPSTGTYQLRQTEPVELDVQPNGAQTFVELKSYKGAGVTLSKQSEGVWHNQKANKMNDVLNAIVVCLASWFWVWLALGIVGFFVAFPIVRERRRRALDVRYRVRAEAYAAFRKLPENDPTKWAAFLEFLAVSFGAEGQAWTVSDSEAALKSLGIEAADLEAVVALHHSIDAQDYSARRPEAEVRTLNTIGKRVLALVGRVAVLALLVGTCLPNDAHASEWDDAEQLFASALDAQAGSDAAAALYADAALKFQAVAEAGDRPGIAWYNAGNAWFQTGALGRAIVAYRQARMYRPFDQEVVDSLTAARALALTEVPDDQKVWWLPTIWAKALLLVLLALLAAAVLLYLRYQTRSCILLSILAVCFSMLAASLWILSVGLSGKFGVVVVDSVLARKGPAYAYASAFHEPLQDGVEFRLKETRDEWAFVELTDGRACWVPLSQVQLIR